MKIILGLSIMFSSWFMINQDENKPHLERRVSSHYVSYDRALDIAKHSNKTIMIKLTAEHCKYCKKMDREVMNKKEVLSLLDKSFIPVEIDVDREPLPLGLKRTITPTFVFVDKNQRILSKIPGSWNKKDFLELLTSRVYN